MLLAAMLAIDVLTVYSEARLGLVLIGAFPHTSIAQRLGVLGLHLKPENLRMQMQEKSPPVATQSKRFASSCNCAAAPTLHELASGQGRHTSKGEKNTYIHTYIHTYIMFTQQPPHYHKDPQ